MATDREIQLLIKAKDEAGGVLSGHLKQLDDLTQAHLGMSLKAVAAYAAVATAIATTVKATYEFTAEMARLGDAADEMSQRTGMAVEELSKWDYVLKKDGSSVEEFEGATRKLARAMYDAQQGGKEQQAAFAALGVEITGADGKLISVGEAMLRVADGLKNTKDETARTALMMEVLGRGSGNLAIVMGKGREEITASMDELERFGGVMTGEFATASAQFEDSQGRLAAAWKGLKMALAEPLMEPLADATDIAARAVADLNAGFERQLRLRMALGSIGLGFMVGAGVAAPSTGALPGDLNINGAPALPGVADANAIAALRASLGPERWSPIGGPADDTFELGNLESSAEDFDAVLKEAATQSMVLKDNLAEVGDTGSQSAQMIGQAMASALEQAIFEARDLDDILGGLAQSFVSMGLMAVFTPGAGFLGLEQGGRPLHAASGMSVRGGIPGVDSVPVLAQAGEEIIDRTLSMELRSFLASARYGGAGGSVKGAATVGPVSVYQQFAFPVRESDRRDIGRQTRKAVALAQGDVL